MKIFTTVTEGYTAEEIFELFPDKFENIEQWYLENFRTCDDLHEFYTDTLKSLFPDSTLDVQFSLAYCQGDGVNIYGDLFLTDFLKIWNVPEKFKKTMRFYLDNTYYRYYRFENNTRYCFSQKNSDNLYINYFIDDFIDDLKNQAFKNINENVIKMFFNDMINHFSELDKEFEANGYNYFYAVGDDDEIFETCEINEYYFDENGNIIY